MLLKVLPEAQKSFLQGPVVADVCRQVAVQKTASLLNVLLQKQDTQWAWKRTRLDAVH